MLSCIPATAPPSTNVLRALGPTPLHRRSFAPMWQLALELSVAVPGPDAGPAPELIDNSLPPLKAS